MKRLMPFEKYEATGNDFVILDCFEIDFIELQKPGFIKLLCDRHFGIGADGLIVLVSEEGYDFRMKYYNSDGQKSSFCGNGSRAALKYMATKHFLSEFSFVAEDGIHLGKLEGPDISVKMKDISESKKCEQGILIDSGSPHLIIEVKDPWNYPVLEEGKRIRKLFGQEGINVNFISFSNQKLRIATYERGVENETLACGTGVTAAAYYLCIVQNLLSHQNISVEAKGGKLKVELELSGNRAANIWLTGPAHKVFSGFYDFDSSINL